MIKLLYIKLKNQVFKICLEIIKTLIIILLAIILAIIIAKIIATINRVIIIGNSFQDNNKNNLERNFNLKLLLNKLKV